MTNLSRHDRKELETCELALQQIVGELSEVMAVEVIQGHRSLEEHKRNLATGKSRAKVSKHCSFPARAVDVAPQGARAAWAKGKDLKPEAYVKVANALLSIAAKRGELIRWGGDWDMKNDGNPKGTLNDLVHFEMMEV